MQEERCKSAVDITKLHLRKAVPADCDLLYLWCNDPQCRAASLNQEPIPYEKHCRWFLEKLASDACEIYICMQGSDAVGQVRLEIEDNKGKISYSVADSYRGRGLGQRMLHLLEEVMPQAVEVLYAVVKEKNTASQRCFEKLGYRKETGEGLYRYWKVKETAIVMAAGLGSRMLPLTKTVPKPLIPVGGTPMVETVLEGLCRRGVQDIYIVVGYLGESFQYLEEKYHNVHLIVNRQYDQVNNISSIYAATHVMGLANCFICEADLYVADPSVFDAWLPQSCYFGKMLEGYSDDWVFSMDGDRIIRIGKGGHGQYNMTGISYFQKKDAAKIADAVKDAYKKGGYEEMFWDEVVDGLLEDMELTIFPVHEGQIVEIDTPEELRQVVKKCRVQMGGEEP